MYERTPLSRGESLDPNPMVPGEYIEHKHGPIVCISGLCSFPMLKVGLLCWCQHSGILNNVVVFNSSTSCNCVSFQKAKADPHVSSAVEVRTRKWSLILRLIITYVFISNKCWIPLILQDKNDTKWIAEEYDTSSATKNSSVKIRDHVIATTWKDGPYLLVVTIESSKPKANWSLTCETF